MPTKILGDPVELDRHLIENGYAEAFAAPPSTNYETPFIYTGRPSELQIHVSKEETPTLNDCVSLNKYVYI